MPTPDILDARIRAFVTELIESAPQAPALPQLELGDHQQVAPGPNVPGDGPTRRTPHRPDTIRVLISTAVVLAALAGIATLVAVGPRSRQPTAVGPGRHLRPADQPPAAVSGNEQTIQSMPVPAFFTQDQSSPGNCWDSIGAPQALSVGESPTFVSWTASPAPDTSCSPSPTMAALTYQGNGLRDGTGTDTSIGGATGTVGGASTAVLVVGQWPVSGQALYVWNGLPSGAAYVTYSSQGTSLYWEKPLNGTAAFLVPQQFKLPDVLPVLTAYDAAGDVLGTGIVGHWANVRAPQVGILHLGSLTGS
jgi:hypothetical protein